MAILGADEPACPRQVQMKLASLGRQKKLSSPGRVQMKLASPGRVQMKAAGPGRV